MNKLHTLIYHGENKLHTLMYHGENKLHTLMKPLLKCLNNVFNILSYTYIQTFEFAREWSANQRQAW
jgi:hypothetical protein